VRAQEQLRQALYSAEVNYQQVVDQLQGMQSKLDEAKELADVATIDVERYKRLAVQQEKSITALQARLEGTEARARDGAVNADLVDQLRTERDQMAALLKKVRPAQLLLTQARPRRFFGQRA